MHGLFRLLVVGCGLALWTGAGLAQPVQELTPEASVRLGLTHHGLLEAAAAEAAAARAAYRQLRAQRLPAFRTRAAYTRLSDNIPEIRVDVPPLPGIDPSSFTIAPVELNRYHAEVSVEQPLFTGFRLHNRIQAAARTAEAAAHEAAQQEVDVAYEVRQAYWQLYRARALRAVVAQAEAQVEAYVQDVRNRHAAGAATQGDLLTARTRRAEVRLERVEAESAVRLAQLELNRLVGLPLATEVQPVGTPAVAPLPAAEVLIEQALGARPQLHAMAAQVEALTDAVEAARGAWLPEAALTGRYVYARPNPYFFTEQDAFKGTWEAGVALSWDLWAGGARGAATSEAQARLRGATARLDDARERVAVEVTRQYLAVRRATEVLAVTAEGVDQAAEAFRITRQRYEEGAALSADVLDAELAYRTALLRRTEAEAAYALARAGLLHTLGQVW